MDIMRMSNTPPHGSLSGMHTMFDANQNDDDDSDMKFIIYCTMHDAVAHSSFVEPCLLLFTFKSP